MSAASSSPPASGRGDDAAASPRLFHFWMENGEVAFQIQVRVWRFCWLLTFWKEYGHV